MTKGIKKQQNKFYAVKKGKKPGIYKSWNDCKNQVNKFPRAIHKSFKTLYEAIEFMGIENNKENI